MESISALVETGIPSFDRLLDHRSPDVLAFVPLSGDCLQRLRYEFERLVERRALVLRRTGLRIRSRRPAPVPGFRRLHTHQIVVIEEFVAVADEQVGAGI